MDYNFTDLVQTSNFCNVLVRCLLAAKLNIFYSYIANERL